MAPKLTVRIWPEDDGWHIDVKADPETESLPSLAPYESFSTAKAAFRTVADAMRRATFVKLDARPDDADD